MTGEQLLTIEQVTKKTSASKAYVYQLMSKDQFPKPVKVGRASRWVGSEVDNWIDKLKSQREATL